MEDKAAFLGLMCIVAVEAIFLNLGLLDTSSYQTKVAIFVLVMGLTGVFVVTVLFFDIYRDKIPS